MSSATVVAAGTYTLDTAGSRVGLSSKAMWGLATVTGTFTPTSGTAEVRDDATASATITIDAASVNTAHKQRDAHLRSAAFFDVANHPTITFTVRNATLGADGKTVTVDGQLTVRGVTRAQNITATITDATPNAVTLTTTFDADRHQFGASWNRVGMLRGLTTMTATLRFTRA